MIIKIHRTAASAGETLVELSTAKTRILFDLGTNTDEGGLSGVLPDLDIPKFDAVFLSHSHTDYAGLANKTVYLSELNAKIITAAHVYNMKKEPAFSGLYQDRLPIEVGDMKITPILIDMEAYDAYLFVIEGEGKRILYTGDFRANGRRSFEEMLENIPAKVDFLLCEGMGLTKADVNSITERDLEEKAAELIAKKTGPVFILQSATDIDRTATMFHAAKRCSRLFLEDLFMANITDAIGNIAPNPNGFIGVNAFLTTGYQPEHIRYQLFRSLNRIDKNQLSSQKFAMCVRPGMKKYLKGLAQSMRFYDGALIVSFPAGEQPDCADFIEFAKKKGLEIISLRTSGHADARALQALVSKIHPTRIMPIFKENVNWFVGEFHGIRVIKDDNTAV